MDSPRRTSRDPKDKTLERTARVLLPAALLLSSAVLSFGQLPDSRGISGYFLGGLFPAGAFNEHVSQEGFMLGAFSGKMLWNAPVYVGVELSFGIYGYAHRHEFLDGIPEVRLDVETLNYLVQALLFLRVEPRKGAIRPFVEGLAGSSYLFTETTIRGHQFPWNAIASDTNFDDFAMSAGAGGGLAIHLDRGRVQSPDRPRRETLIEIKVRYMAGGRAKYLKQGSIVVEGNEFTFTVDQSATSFITAQAALSFSF
jgi:hypothetical protein